MGSAWKGSRRACNPPLSISDEIVNSRTGPAAARYGNNKAAGPESPLLLIRAARQPAKHAWPPLCLPRKGGRSLVGSCNVHSDGKRSRKLSQLQTSHSKLNCALCSSWRKAVGADKWLGALILKFSPQISAQKHLQIIQQTESEFSAYWQKAVLFYWH